MSLATRLVSRSAMIFALRLGGAGIVFALQAAMARLWGAAALGEFLIVVAAVNLMAMVMPMGFHTVAAYFAAEYGAHGRRTELHRFLRRAYTQLATVAALLLVIGLMVGDAATKAIGLAPALLAPTWLMAVGTAIIFVNGAVLVGLKLPIAGFAADGIFRPLLMVAGFLVALVVSTGGEGLVPMMWIAASGFAVVAVAHLGYVLTVARRLGDTGPVEAGEARRWWRFAWPWMIIAVATDFFFDLDLIHLATLMGREELAVFGVTARIFGLVAFALSAVYAVSLPHVLESEAARDRIGFLRRIGDANLAAAVLAAVILIGSLIAGPLVLMVFGPEFASGALPLVILCLGLLVRAAFGPTAVVLSVHERPQASLPAVLVGVVALLLGNAVLVPAFGITGAAVAALVATTLWSATMWATAKRVTGVDVSVLPRLREMMARRLRVPAE